MVKLSLLIFGIALQKSEAVSAGKMENFLECVRQMEKPHNDFQRDCARYAFEGRPAPRAADYAARNQRSTYGVFKAEKSNGQCKAIKCSRDPLLINIFIFERSGYRVSREKTKVHGNKIDIGRCVGFCQRTANTFRNNFDRIPHMKMTTGCTVTKTESIFVTGESDDEEILDAITRECS